MKVSVFGIGYVGAVTAACLVRDGHAVIAVDPNEDKVRTIREGRAPIVEPGLERLIADGVTSGLLRATSSAAEAIAETELSFICVGTPSLHSGNLDLGFVARVCEQIGAEIAKKEDFHSIVVRSTMLPGSMDQTVIALLERFSGRKAGEGFGIAIYPEFLREGSAIADYDAPSVIVIGRLDAQTLERVRALNSRLAAPEYVTDYATAEAIKYANNAWHAVKVSFANEIGNISGELGIDGHAVMTALCMDTKLNLSPVYLRPGFAYGGSCLPKDLRALRYKAKALDLAVPLLEAAAASNDLQIDRAMRMITSQGRRRVGMLGLSFKAGTDDLRESPLLELAERLHGKGYDLRIFDPNVRYAFLQGANLQYVRSHLPHLSALMVDRAEDILSHAETVVIGNRDPRFAPAIDGLRPDQTVVDLVRHDPARRSGGNYQGICW
ncbi:nucleotide sugar dehydrogenase [Zavarzinia sp. CC-PAN008]|uniref:nucleotide sugar dehydrogenase n=1 Tax=Zavarzinia sp. CC-PAN008 TaxID=3243332 RepID=UPI003F745CFF